MLKFLLIEVGGFLLIILVITQILVPSFIHSLPFFWLFKKTKAPAEATPPPFGVKSDSLEALSSEVDQTANQYKTTQQKIQEAEEIVESLKSKIQPNSNN